MEVQSKIDNREIMICNNTNKTTEERSQSLLYRC